MKDNNMDLMLEVISRQLGRKPSLDEVKNMKRLLSVQVNDSKKMKKALEALDDVYSNECCSWFDGQYERNKDCLDNVGIFYRGNTITKREMYDRAISIAKAMYANGVRKGDVFPCCVSNIPDLITILLATSYIGARINIFDSFFDSSYVKKIVDSCDSSFIFCSDDQYGNIASILDDTKVKRCVLLSLNDHLPKKFPDKYIKLGIPRELYDFPNRAIEYKNLDDSIVLIDDFILDGCELNSSDVKDKNPSIYDEFTITYSSGSSRPGMPKAIPHKVLGYLTMMRFHDSDMTGLPDLSNIVGLAHIPPISDTDVKSVISDTMGQRSIVACEPIYGRDTFIYSLMMNEPNFCDATRSSWVQFAKDVLLNSNFKDIDLSYLGLPLAVGEPLEVNERRFVDKAFKSRRAGREILRSLGLPLPHTYLGEGGGRTESGGVVYTIFQSLFENLNKPKLRKGKYGMAPCLFVDAAIIDSNGNECGVNEIGELCVDSPCTMSDYKYYYDEDNGNDFMLSDNYSREWPKFGVYAYRNEIGNIIMKGRMGSEFVVDNGRIPEFVINDIILADKRRVLSSEVVNCNNIPVVDLEINPLFLKDRDVNHEISKVLFDIDNRLSSILPYELYSNVVYRIRNNDYRYPVTGCAKRDNNSLISDSIDQCIKPIVVNDNICLISASDYFKVKDKMKFTLVKKNNFVLNVVNKVKKKIKSL